MIPVDLRELVDGFVSESLDNLDDNEIKISKLNGDYDSDNVESIFRVFHTLKGLSGFFELFVIQKVTHSAETLLDLIRTYHLSADNSTIDLLFVVFDFLQNALKSAGENFTDELFKEESLLLLDQLDSVVNEINRQVDNPEDNPEDEIYEEDSTESDPVNATDLDGHYKDFIEKVNIYLSEFGNAIKQLSKSFSNDIIDQILKVLAQFKAPSSLLELRAVNRIIGCTELFIRHLKTKGTKINKSAAALLEKIRSLLVEIVDYIENNQNDDEYLQPAEMLCEEINREMNSVQKKKTESDTKKLSLIELIDSIDECFIKVESDENDMESLNTIVNNLILMSKDNSISTNSEMKDVVSSIQMILESVVAGDINAGAIVHVIKSDFKILGNFIRENATKEIEDKAVETNKPEPVKESAPAKKITIANAQEIVDKKSTKEMIKPESEKNVVAERKEVRVSTDKLNKLFDLVGEIITIESMVVNNKNLEGLKLPDFKVASNMLNKLVRELQKITMSIRMIPLDGLFNKMSRLVRDLSRKFDKPVELEIYGAETEMDKNVIEQLSDPLVHMIRNCIDHGIEDEAGRLDKGKPITGKIIIGASYQGNEIHITVEDDGAGLNREKIIEKAISRGNFGGNPAELTDKEVWEFIFQPGLSTAKVVTDVSGRGVGMDVVKKNIEKLRGGIDIDSKYGFGTKITFRIPLTLAIMDAMIVRVGTTKYAIPILSVRESFQPKLKDVTKTMDGIEVVKVRNEMFPIVRLHEIMARKPDNYELDKGILMMLNTHSKRVCLFVDEILGQQQAVVKPLSEYIGEVQGLTGCMVMADGKIGLILDVDGLIDKAENFK